MPLKKDEEMIAVNITALVGLTKLFGADMIKAGKGRIMNVASLLAFLPFPYYSVYSATKSFVLAFTETISAETEGKGVFITALCPGPVAVSYTHLRAHETVLDLVCRLLLEKNNTVAAYRIGRI